jgi:hypothetical protein
MIKLTKAFAPDPQRRLYRGDLGVTSLLVLAVVGQGASAVVASTSPPRVDGWWWRLVAEPHNRLHSHLPLHLFLPLPSFSFLHEPSPSSTSAPPLLRSDRLHLDLSLPRLDTGRGRPSETLCLGALVGGGPQRVPRGQRSTTGRRMHPGQGPAPRWATVCCGGLAMGLVRAIPWWLACLSRVVVVPSIPWLPARLSCAAVVHAVL